MTFLPNDYAPPQTGNYMRLQQGENRFRILSNAITGTEFWSTDDQGGRTPNRRRPGVAVDSRELGVDKHGKPERAKHFWAFAVWNNVAKSVQILQITQKTIQDGIIALSQSEDWGDPINAYDILVTKTGSGLDTEYTVMPGKPAPTDQAILDEYATAGINLEALYDNGDPFDGSATPPPQAGSNGHPEEMLTATVTQVNFEKEVYWVETSEGKFATMNGTLGSYVSDRTGSPMDLTFKMTDKGGRQLLKAVPAEHAAMDESSIPFSVAV